MAKYQKYAEYKDSGVEWLGEIPSHWKVVKLSYKLRLLSGDGITAFDIEDTGTYPVFGGNGLRGFTEKYNCDGEYALVGRQGALCGNINVARGKFFATEHAVVVYPYEKFNLTYLSEFLRFMDLGQYSVSAAQPGIAVDRINALPIVIPTLDEQNSIGDFLDHETTKIDHLIEKQQQLIELLKEKRQAVISHAVTKGLDPNVPMKDSGVEWLGKVPEHWVIPRLKQLIKYGSSISYGIVQPGDALDEGIPFIQTTNISKGSFELQDFQKTSVAIESNYPRSRLEGGEVILGIRASIGAAFVVPMSFKGVNLSRGIARIIPNALLKSDFLVWYFKSNAVYQYWGLSKQGSTFSEVSIETVRELSVVVPPIDEQEKISEFLSFELGKLERLISSAENQKLLLLERRTALISAAVTGKIDVRHWQSPTFAGAQTELSA